jgi:hypothetical protein
MTRDRDRPKGSALFVNDSEGAVFLPFPQLDETMEGFTPLAGAGMSRGVGDRNPIEVSES